MVANNLRIEYRDINALIPYARNARTHSPAQIDKVAASIREYGWTNPILVDGESGIIAGHARLEAARKLGLKEVPVIELAHLTPAQKRAYILADNRLALDAGWDDELLALELEELSDAGFDLALTGLGDDELSDLLADLASDNIDGDGDDAHKAKLSDRFLVPPFSVLNAREGWWQSRKKAWLAYGIRSELGRDEIGGATTATSYESQDKLCAIMGSDIATGTSIFDPVLCELVYLWFSPPGGLVLDPFAGGSVRGIVASKLGRRYVGVDLRPEQVEANRIQGDEICADDENPPVWIPGDSRNIDKLCADVDADLVFSCPPYADLEVYSDDPRDLSTMDYDDFRAAYYEIVRKTCDRLKPNSFACFVVGEVRDKKGNYIDFVGDTVQAFRDAGLAYYNEAILVTAVGSLPIRVARHFRASRKLGKTHQNVLVFVKGDGRRAAERCGDVDIDAAMGCINEHDMMIPNA